MNLVGKIFTVLVLVMSLIFMAFSLAVYATHKNWRMVVLNPKEEATAEHPPGLLHKLNDSMAETQRLEEQLNKVETDLEEERSAQRQALAKLENENDELQRHREQSEKKYADLIQEKSDAVAGINAAHETLGKLREEVEKLRVSIREARKDRSDHFQQVLQTTDKLHQSVNELKRLKKRQADLAADLAKADEVLRHFGHSKDEDTSDIPPDGVPGVVLATPESGLIEISIGADDGIRRGHRLEAFRIGGGASTYLGQVEVVDTAPDKAVCKVIPELRKGTIQRGDHVSSKIQ